jgi:Amt family ammonium transporter
VVFSTLWVTLVYSPVAHWVWGGGFLGNLGALDFAGGTVVHINSGIAGLAAALVLGKRKGHGREKITPHNVPFTVIGAGLLWFGWFGFNAGSELAADGIAANAFVVTNTATAAAALAWMIGESFGHGKPTAVGAASGAVAGLVAITPAAGFVTPLASILIGAGSGFICYWAVVSLKTRMGYDDALDVFGIHCIGGVWGALATGIFAAEVISGRTGLLEGNVHQFGIQIVAVLATLVYSFVVTFVLLKILDGVMGLRVDEETETIGLDQTQHSESGYNFF